MAELLDVALGLCEEAESCSELTSVYKWGARARERIMLFCFSLGKIADIAADWVALRGREAGSRLLPHFEALI